jgi:hypothetical protein
MVQDERGGSIRQAEEGEQQVDSGLQVVSEENGNEKGEGLKEVLEGPGVPKMTPEMIAVARFAQYVGSLSDLYGGIKKNAVMAAVEREMLASQQYLRQILAGVIESYVQDEE